MPLFGEADVPHPSGVAVGLKYAATLFKKIPLLRHAGQVPLQPGQLLFLWIDA
jgi:hypothetical protein